MNRKILILFIIMSLCFISCQNDDEQNLDISVIGKVTDQNNNGIADVSIYVQRGRTGNYVATVYNQYVTLTTNSSGNYSYLVKDDTYNYKICCDIPSGYTINSESCKAVNHSIISSQTVPNIINFQLNQ
jgi:hypothetical protein